MSKLRQSSDKASALSKKISQLLRVHDSRVMGSLDLDSDQVTRCRDFTLTNILAAFTKGTPEIEGVNDLLVIGKPGDYYVYVDRPFAVAVKHYCKTVRIYHHVFLADTSISIHQVSSGFFRAKEVYLISDQPGSIRELDPNGLELSKSRDVVSSLDDINSLYGNEQPQDWYFRNGRLSSGDPCPCSSPSDWGSVCVKSGCNKGGFE